MAIAPRNLSRHQAATSPVVQTLCEKWWSFPVLFEVMTRMRSSALPILMAAAAWSLSGNLCKSMALSESLSTADAMPTLQGEDDQAPNRRWEASSTTAGSSSPNTRLVGQWTPGRGPCRAVAVSGATAYFSQGGDLMIVDVS